jgi:hypothetical protein
VEKLIRAQEQGGAISLFSFHPEAGRIRWCGITLLHFESIQDFMCFLEFFVINRFYIFSPSKLGKKPKNPEEIKKWINSLAKVPSQLFDLTSMYVAVKEEFLQPSRTGDDLKIFKYLADRLKSVLPPEDLALDLFHLLPAYVSLDDNMLIDPYRAKKPFHEIDFPEQFERIIKILEEDPTFRKEFPIDLRTYLFYESCRQKTASFSMFNDREISSNNFYFMNLSLDHFFQTYEDAMEVFHTFPNIAGNFICNPEKEFLNIKDFEQTGTTYNQSEFTAVLNYYLFPSTQEEEEPQSN